MDLAALVDAFKILEPNCESKGFVLGRGNPASC